MLCRAGVFFFSSRRRHTRYWRDWSSDVCSSDLVRTRIGNGEPWEHLVPAAVRRRVGEIYAAGKKRLPGTGGLKIVDRLKPNAASFFKWGPGVCTQIVAKGYVVDSGRPNALGYRTVARPLQMRERARHRAIRAFQRHSWRRVPCKKGPPCLAASLCAHYGPPATRRRAHWAAGGTPGPRSVGALPLSQAHSPLVAYDSFGLPARECSRPAPSRPRVRTASLSIAQFLLSYAFHHFVGERLGLLRGLGGGDEGQEVFDDVAHPGEAIAARREARLRGGCVHHSAHQVIGDHGGMDLLGDHFRAGAGELLQFQRALQRPQIQFDIPAFAIQLQ